MTAPELTDSELLVLGLVAEMPRHGYELEQVIDQRGMREWTQIGFSSIYFVLGKLEQKRLVEARTPATARSRKVHKLTRKGKKTLVNQTVAALKAMRPSSSPLLMGMIHWPVLTRGQALDALQTRKEAVAKELERIENIHFEQQPLPDHVDLMFAFCIGQLKAEADWIATPTEGRFTLVDVPQIRFAVIDGKGNPESDECVEAVKWLYSVVHVVKPVVKKRMGKNFVEPPLEFLCWADKRKDLAEGNKEKWKWRVMIVFIDWITQKQFEDAVAKVALKRGPAPKTLRLENLHEGKSVQIMHVGDYQGITAVCKKLYNHYLPENNLKPHGYYHEIYLNDPARTAPEKRKIVIRQPVISLSKRAQSKDVSI